MLSASTDLVRCAHKIRKHWNWILDYENLVAANHTHCRIILWRFLGTSAEEASNCSCAPFHIYLISRPWFPVSKLKYTGPIRFHLFLQFCHVQLFPSAVLAWTRQWQQQNALTTHSAAAAAASSFSSSWVLFVCAELSLSFFQAADHDSLVQELGLNYTSDSLPQECGLYAWWPFLSQVLQLLTWGCDQPPYTLLSSSDLELAEDDDDDVPMIVLMACTNVSYKPSLAFRPLPLWRSWSSSNFRKSDDLSFKSLLAHHPHHPPSSANRPWILSSTTLPLHFVAAPLIDFQLSMKQTAVLKNPTPFLLHVQSITPLLVTPTNDFTNFLQRLLQSFLQRLLQSFLQSFLQRLLQSFLQRLLQSSSNSKFG